MSEKEYQTLEEPPSGIVRKKVEEAIVRYDRRRSDRLFELVKPIIPWAICGIIVAAITLWQEVNRHEQDILKMQLDIRDKVSMEYLRPKEDRIVRLEELVRQENEKLAQLAIELAAHREREAVVSQRSARPH